MLEDLQIIHYPDPRLKKPAKRIEHFDQPLRDLAARMFELMREAKGVGLAAPQVGQSVRLFVMNHTGKPEDDRVYVNPALSDPDGEETAEEGCLSLPGIHVDIPRHKRLRIEAQDLAGERIDQIEAGYIARIWQHETDHLNGTLLTDRMGPTALMTNRKILKELEEEYAAAHPIPPPPPSRAGAKSKRR
jgi:peptide deformylase